MWGYVDILFNCFDDVIFDDVKFIFQFYYYLFDVNSLGWEVEEKI